jgi:hypothetical protein
LALGGVARLRPGRACQRGGRGGPPEVLQHLEAQCGRAETLTIKQQDGAFLVGDDSGQIRHLYPDVRTANTDDGEVKTHWQGDEMVTETIPARGPRLRETFALSPDRRRLFVTAHFEPPWGGAVDVRRVYDAAERP